MARPPITILALGAGIQSTALALMAREGKFGVNHVVFADPGAELPETYEHLQRFESWGIRVDRVAREPSLVDWLYTEKHIAIPYHGPNGLGRRNCTVQWKIRPIQRFARSQGARALRLLIGLSIDEVGRVKPAREKWVERVWPLIDMGMTRADCAAYIEGQGIPVPEKSGCYFCPLQPRRRWQVLASAHPDLFRRAVELEGIITGRAGVPLYLSSSGRPLSDTVSENQMMLNWEMEECNGFCFV